MTSRAELQQLSERGSHDRSTINRILDAGFLASIGFCVGVQPFVIPTLYGRNGQTLYLHGAAASRMLLALKGGIPACVSVTLVDGLVLARSAFHHSMNYRSVVAFGHARALVDPREKVEALRIISEHLIAGRWEDVRRPNKKELSATTVLEFVVEEASAKVRAGPPSDEEKDYTSTTWAGVLPLGMNALAPIPDDRLGEGVAVPDYVQRYGARLDTDNSIKA